MMLGNSANAESSAGTKMLYAGEQYDSNLSQYYLRARYYDQSNGRFNRTDPYAGSPQDPQSLHKYLYCHANPVNNIDPTGLFSYGEMLCVATLVASLSALVAGTIGYFKGYSAEKIEELQWKWFWRGFAIGAIVYGAAWAIHSLWVLMFGGGSAATLNGGQDLYRVIDDSELDNINSTGSFQFPSWGDTPTGEPGKYFWGTLEEALAWKEQLIKWGESNIIIVKTTIEDVTPVWRFGGIADGIGNSYFVAMEYLTNAIEVVRSKGG